MKLHLRADEAIFFHNLILTSNHRTPGEDEVYSSGKNRLRGFKCTIYIPT